MRLKWTVVFLLGFSMLILTGCNEVEDILAKVNQLLDEQLEGSDTDKQNVTSGDEELMEQGGPAPMEGDEEEGDSTDAINSSQPVEEKLLAAGYTSLDPPNGLPLQFPSDWILVEDNSEDMEAESYEGMFCFERPADIQELAHQVAEPYDGSSHEYFGEDQAIIHRTSLFENSDYEEWYGELAYFNESDYSCAFLSFWFGPYEVHEQYGEDPDTMVSEEELR